MSSTPIPAAAPPRTGVRAAIRKRWRGWLRAIHRDLGYLAIGLTVIYAVSGLAISASNELGELQSGLAAALLGPVAAVAAGGVAAVAITGLWSYLFPELRQARTFDPPPEVLANPPPQGEKRL